MKHLIYWAVFLLLPAMALSQSKFDYKVSEPYKVIDAGTKAYFSSAEKGKMLSVKISGKDVNFQSFDARSMKEVKRAKVSDLPKGFQIEALTWLGGKIYLFFALWDKESEMQQLFAREIDFDNCQFKGEAKKIIALKGKLAYPAFSFLYSQDKSMMLIQSRRKPEKVRDDLSYDKIIMHVFNENLSLVANNEIKMPYTEKQMDNVDYSIDSEGNPYILAKVRPDGSDNNVKGKRGDKVANYHIELFKINVKAATIKVSKVEVEDKFIAEIWLYEGTDNTMLCAGYYNKNAGSGADGLFLFRISKEGDIEHKKFYEIPVEILNQYISVSAQNKNERKEKNGNAEFLNLELRELIVQDDNSIILIGEQFYVTVSYDSKGNARYTYHYDDMLIAKIAPNGELAWMRKLPKRQFGSAYRGGMGFEHMAIGENHYLVFLDNIKNLELDIDKFPAAHADGRGGFLTAYRLDDATGKVGKVSILDTKKIAEGYTLYQFNTERMLPVSEDEFLIEFYIKGKEDVMIKVKVK